jgi:isoquinoline 1-oxidoreductase beta subunit
MLIAAAAQKWGVDKSACRAEKSTVVNTATNARLTYGSLAEAAAKLPVPANVALKDPSQFKIVGKSRKRLDTPGKVDGSITFGIDVRLPNMLYAVVERCPVFGGTVASFDDTKTKATPGVKSVVKISNGVAVIADSTWAAMEGTPQTGGPVGRRQGGRAQHARHHQVICRCRGAGRRSAVAQRGRCCRGAGVGVQEDRGGVSDAVPGARSHGAAELHRLGALRWRRCLGVDADAELPRSRSPRRRAGCRRRRSQVHTEYMGGGFGRRGGVDYIGEAVEVAKSVDVPVKVTWSREDDMQHDTYRPASYCRFAGGVDAEGWPVAWTASIACPAFAGANTSTEGVRDMAYTVPNFSVDYHDVNPGVPVSYWRSVGYSQNCFFAESFLDEMAHAGGKDPVEVRRRFLAEESAPAGGARTGRRKGRLGASRFPPAEAAAFRWSITSAATPCRSPKSRWRRER